MLLLYVFIAQGDVSASQSQLIRGFVQDNWELETSMPPNKNYHKFLKNDVLVKKIY